MPFTPAHPAIVLPFLKRKYFSATALIAGSVSPDFEYFFKAQVHGVHGHTLWGVLYFDFPVAVFLSIVFHGLVKKSLIENLPEFFQVRFGQLKSLDFIIFIKGNILVFISSTMLGAFSHLFWDGFTHNGTYFVTHLTFYEGSYIPLDGAKYPLWYALQHVSTVVGLTLIALYIIFLPVDYTKEVTQPKIIYWFGIGLLALLFFVARFALFSIRFNLGNAVVTAISSILLALIFISAFMNLKSTQVIKSNG